MSKTAAPPKFAHFDFNQQFMRIAADTTYLDNGKRRFISITTLTPWLGNPLGIPQKSGILPILDLLVRNFHQNFILSIAKCVPANSEHVPSCSESSPAIDSSDFMNRKMFPP